MGPRKTQRTQRRRERRDLIHHLEIKKALAGSYEQANALVCQYSSWLEFSAVGSGYRAYLSSAWEAYRLRLSSVPETLYRCAVNQRPHRRALPSSPSPELSGSVHIGRSGAEVGPVPRAGD